MATGVSILLRGLEGIPGLPGASQDEAVRTRKFEMSHGGGATCRSTSISWSTLEKNPLHGHLFEGNPVGEDTTRRGTDTPVHRPETPVGSTHSSKRGLRPPEQLRGKRSSLPQTRRGLTLRSQLCRDPEVGGSESETERKPEVPASPRDEALFHCANHSGVPRGPANSTASLTSQGHPGKFPQVPCRSRGK